MHGRETDEKLKGFPGRFKYQAEAGNYETALSHPSIVYMISFSSKSTLTIGP